MATAAQLEQAFESLRAAFRGVAQEFDQVSLQIDNGATLEEVQGRLDYFRSQFEQLYAQVESLRTQALTIDPRPDAFIARLDNSLNVNRPTNFQALGNLTTKAGQNTNKRNAETAAKASADQGPGTVSAGETATQAQEARDNGANPQNPTNQPTGNTASISNAESSQPQTPGELPQSPKLPPAQAQGSSVVPTASNSSQPAPGRGVQALTGGVLGSTQQSFVYKAISCTSKFSRGQFTQELHGSLLQFPVSVIRAASSNVVPAGSSVASATGSTATQAEVRGVDNAIAAAQTPNQSAAESARLAAAGRTPDQSSAETARLAAQAGRVAAGAVSGAPNTAALGTGLVTTAAGAAGINPALVPFASPGATNVIGALGTAAPALAAATGNPQITRAAQALVPAQSFVATSLGQPVGLGQQGSIGASQSVVARTPAVTVNLIGGGTATVTTVDQALALYSQGRISLEQRDRALSQLASLSAAQQPTQTVNRQPVGYEP